jgi:hypothetical protein
MILMATAFIWTKIYIGAQLMSIALFIQVYVLRPAHKLGIDIESAVEKKMRKNAEKYPVHLAKGNAKKYTEY